MQPLQNFLGDDTLIRSKNHSLLRSLRSLRCASVWSPGYAGSKWSASHEERVQCGGSSLL